MELTNGAVSVKTAVYWNQMITAHEGKNQIRQY